MKKSIIITGFDDLAQLHDYLMQGVISVSPVHSTMEKIIIGYVDLDDPNANQNVELSLHENPVSLPTGSDWHIRVNVSQDYVTGWRFALVNFLMRLIATVADAETLEFSLEVPE